MRSRRGFTLIEMMMGLVLTMMVGGVIYELLLRNQRVSRIQTEHVGMQENVRAGALIIANELREVGYDSIPPLAVATLVAGAGAPTAGASDILVAQSGRIRYKAMRGVGFLCALAGNTAVVTASSAVGIRAPAVGDSVSIYVEGDPDTNTDDAWINAGITALPNQNCPGGAAGIAMTLGYPVWLSGGWTAQVQTGAPVRLFDVMEMQTVADNGRSWLGLRSVTAGEALQPVIGPLADSTAAVRGLRFRYRDRNGVETAVLKDIRAVQIDLRGITDQATRKSGHFAVDSLALTTRVAMRNTLRP
jgi:prepilin-type N-terminal cleavage/methylation domain-containing protein